MRRRAATGFGASQEYVDTYGDALLHYCELEPGRGYLRSKIVQTMDEAVADVPDGATIMFPGFGRTGYPRNLIAALLRQGAKDLTGVSNRPGNPGAVMDVGHLIEAGRMKKMVCAFTASPYPSRKSGLEIMEEAGEIVSELVPQGTFVERIRAAGAGIGGFYTETGVGTEIAEGKEQPHHRRPRAHPGVPAAGRLRLHTRLPRRRRRQPAVQAVAAQLQPDHGDGCARRP